MASCLLSVALWVKGSKISTSRQQGIEMEKKLKHHVTSVGGIVIYLVIQMAQNFI
jgi:hypothetical protein